MGEQLIVLLAGEQLIVLLAGEQLVVLLVGEQLVILLEAHLWRGNQNIAVKRRENMTSE